MYEHLQHCVNSVCGSGSESSLGEGRRWSRFVFNENRNEWNTISRLHWFEGCSCPDERLRSLLHQRLGGTETTPRTDARVTKISWGESWMWKADYFGKLFTSDLSTMLKVSFYFSLHTNFVDLLIFDRQRIRFHQRPAVVTNTKVTVLERKSLRELST